MDRKLYRIKEGRVVCGVCTGLAAYFNVDVNVVRLGTVILSCVNGIGIVAYAAAAILLPEA